MENLTNIRIVARGKQRPHYHIVADRPGSKYLVTLACYTNAGRELALLHLADLLGVHVSTLPIEVSTYV